MTSRPWYDYYRLLIFSPNAVFFLAHGSSTYNSSEVYLVYLISLTMENQNQQPTVAMAMDAGIFCAARLDPATLTPVDSKRAAVQPQSRASDL